MQGQTQVSSLLSLKTGNASASVDRARPAGEADGGGAFSRLLERPQSAQPGRSVQAQRDLNETSRRQPETRTTPARERQDDASARRAEPRRSEPSRPEAPRQNSAEPARSAQQGQESKGSVSKQPQADRPASRVSEEATEISATKAISAQLDSLSEEDLELLGDKVAALLSGLRAQLESGELDQDAEEALGRLLLALEEGDSLENIAQLLEALPIGILPPDSGLADSEARNLRQLLGRSGAAYLAQLGREMHQLAKVRLSAGEPSPSLSSLANILESNQGADLDKLLMPSRELTASASKEQFAQMLQTLSTRSGAGAGPTDLGQTVTQLGSLTSQEARPPAPLQPSERQFMVQSEVRVPVNQGQWGQAVGQRVLWLAAQNVSSAELRLDPPDLGPMQVKVTSHQDQISVTFTSPQVAVREALDQSATRLREMFAEQGLDLVDVNVSDQSADEQLAGDEQGQGQGGEGRSESEEDRPEEWVGASGLVDHYA